MATLNFYPTGEDLSEVHWRTIIGNRALEGRTLPDMGVEVPDGFAASYRAARQLNTRWWNEHYTAAAYRASTDPIERQGIDEYMERHGGSWNTPYLVAAATSYINSLNPTIRWRFGRTEKGYVGLFPVSALVGDRIYVFQRWLR